MPYNKLAEAKYDSLGLRSRLRGLQPTPTETLVAAKAGLEAKGKRVRVGG
jgi:hypothetical protein